MSEQPQPTSYEEAYQNAIEALVAAAELAEAQRKEIASLRDELSWQVRRVNTLVTGQNALLGIGKKQQARIAWLESDRNSAIGTIKALVREGDLASGRAVMIGDAS